MHVDAAYGGFFTLLAGLAGRAALDAAPWRAIAGCDSVVVDPHKHGLQPYGCGAVLFADPEVGRFYLHDSPYTYFTSGELHLGEISLECSRAGRVRGGALADAAAAAAHPGRASARCLRPAAAPRSTGPRSSPNPAGSTLYQPPELDIVTYFPVTAGRGLSGIDAASVQMLNTGMKQDHPVFLSTLRVTPAAMSQRHSGITADAEGARILRSVLMKPEAEGHVAELNARVEQLAAQAAG